MHLAERNAVALLSLCGSDDGHVDTAIAERCDSVTEVRLPAKQGFSRRLAWGIGMLRGVPPWAVDCRSGEYAELLERLLDDWKPDVVEIHLQAMAQYVDAAARRAIPGILVDYDPGSSWVDDLRATTKGLRRASLRLELAAWRRYERATRPRFQSIVVFADRDVESIMPSAGGASVIRIPLAVDVPAQPLSPTGEGPPTVLFVGGFAHPPNVDAALWLGRSIFPRVLRQVPGARLDIVGHEPGDEVRALAGGSVSVHGSVPDVTPFLDHAAIVVAPIRLGGSMRMKVLEALAAGKALVATPRAAEGLEELAGERFLLAADEDELVDGLVQLLLDAERRGKLARDARTWAEENLSWDRGVEAFERLYDDLIEAR